MIQKLNDEVMTLKRQTHLLLERVRKLETCLTIADENSCQSVSGGTHAEHLEAKIKVLKEEREDNYKKIVELTSKLDQEKIRGDSNYDAVQKTRAELAGWHEVFGTKHLTSAKCIKASRELGFKNQGEANEWQANKIKELNEELCRVIKERDRFKSESDNQAAAWKEIKTFIPDVNGLSLVGMVRRHVENLSFQISDCKKESDRERQSVVNRLIEIEGLKKELAFLKTNNRYQKGYGDGYAFALSDMRKKLNELPPRG